jgi:hypothetical protein
MFTKNKKESTTPDLTVAITKASGILDQRARNRAAARETKRQLEEAEATLRTQRQLLAEAEAISATGSGNQPTDTKAASRYREAREQVELLTIRIEGLDAAYADLDRQLIEVEPELTAERHALFEREVAAFEPVYAEAANAFAAVLRQASALGAGLDFQFSNLLNLRIPANLFTDERKLYLGDDRTREWKSDPAAAALFERIYSRTEVNAKVTGEIKIIKQRAEDAEVVAARQRQDEHFKNGRRTTTITINEHRDLNREQADKEAKARHDAYERSLADCRPASESTSQEAA